MTAFPLRYAATLATTAFLVMLALSCKGNDSDEPAVVPTLASSPQAPTVPRPSPTPTRSPTPRPQPTQPRAVATPPSTLSYSFGPGVDVGDRAVIGNAIEVSRRILASYGAGEPPCTVLAFDTLTGLSQAYARAAGSQGWRAADVVRRLLNGVAEAGYRTVSIYTNSSFWRDADAVERSQAVSHEFIHVVQLEMVGEKLAVATFDTPADRTPPGGPFWLLEGSAELLSWHVIEELRLGNLRSKLDEYAAAAAAGHVALRDMETYVGYVGTGRLGVATSVRGVEALLANRPVSDLFRFWRLVGAGQTWQNAFVLVFGMPVTDFYRTFESTR